MDFGHILNKQFFYISSGHIYSWNRVDRHRSRWDIHNLQNWISDTFSITRTLKKICKDRHCSRRDIRILKNGFQTHLHDQTIDKKREDRHRSRRDIHILKNGFQTPGHSYLEKWIRNISMIIALIKSVRITNVAAGTFTWLVGKFQGSLPHPYEHLHFQKWILDTFLTNNSFTFLQAIFIHEIGWIAIVAAGTFTICKIGFQTHSP